MPKKKKKEKKEKKKRLHGSRPPEEALACLKQLVSGTSLAHLLRICAGLSSWDYFSSFNDPDGLKNWINYPKIRSLTHGVLESNSSLAKTCLLSSQDLNKALNYALDASYDPTALDRATELGDGPGSEVEFQRFFGRMANVQILGHQTSNPVLSAARTVGMLEVLPVSKRKWLSSARQQVADPLAPEITRIIGGAASDIFRVHAAVLVLANGAHRRMASALPPGGKDQAVREVRLGALLDLVVRCAAVQSPFEFTADDLLRRYPNQLTRHQVASYLSLFSRQVAEHRRLLTEPSYQIGHRAWRLSPFDRFPVVEMPGGGYIVPLLGQFAKAFAFVLDYSLFETLGPLQEKYSAFRGFMQEIYLRDLIEDRLASCKCIPERPYGRPEQRGPDLTLIDTRVSRLVLVESKARRMRVETLALMSDETIAQNLHDAFDALEKVPPKIAALYAGLPEYEDVQAIIDTTRAEPPVCVVVLSHLAFEMTRLVRLQARDDPAHPLHGFPYPYCLLSLETFEDLVEVAHRSGPSLAALLLEYWERTHHSGPSAPGAEDLHRPERPSGTQCYADRFLR